MTNIKMGDEVLCINAAGVEENGLQRGVKYIANQVTIIPGQGEFIGVHVESVGQIVIVEASRFERAYTLKYRIFHDTNQFVLVDDLFNEEDHKDKGDSYLDITVTLPESRLEDIDKVLAHAMAQNTFKEPKDATTD